MNKRRGGGMAQFQLTVKEAGDDGDDSDDGS